MNTPVPATPPATAQQTPANGNLAPGNAAQSRPSTSAGRPPINSPAPVDWIHFEGRSVKTTLSNIMGLDGLARERKWRSHCVFSVDVGRRARQGVEAVRSSLAISTYPMIRWYSCIYLTAYPACRRDIFEQILRACPFAPVRGLATSLPAFPYQHRTPTCPARRPLGQRWRRSALRPYQGVLSKHRVGRHEHAVLGKWSHDVAQGGRTRRD